MTARGEDDRGVYHSNGCMAKGRGVGRVLRSVMICAAPAMGVYRLQVLHGSALREQTRHPVRRTRDRLESDESVTSRSLKTA
jgi:hypothetical protein